MSKHSPLSSKELTSPVGKSLLNAFSKTIDRMESRIREKCRPISQVDKSKEILRSFNVNLESHSQQSDAKRESVTVQPCERNTVVFQRRSETAFMKEHGRICNRAPFHMIFTDPQIEDEESIQDIHGTAIEESQVPSGMTLGRFEDSEHSSDEEFETQSLNETETNSVFSPSFTTLESYHDGIPKLSIINEKSPSQTSQTSFDLHALEQADCIQVNSKEDDANSHVSFLTTEIGNVEKHHVITLSSRSLSRDQSNKCKPKAMKFHSANSFSNQTAAESRVYVLGMIGVSRPEDDDKVSARRFYLESCEQQKITPHVSHISKFEGNSATYSSINDNKANLRGIGEKRLLAVSRFIQDRLREDGSQLILSESQIGNDGCKILRNVADDSNIPCKLQSLDLSGNCFNSIGIGILSPILTLSSLKRLTLSKLNLGDSGMCALSEILSGSNSKSSGCLSGGEINGMISPKSPKCSPKNSKIPSSFSQQSVTYLDLSHNTIRTQGAYAIALLIQRSNSLVHLELGWNSIGSSGCSAIEKSLQHNSSITFLGLSWNGLEECGGIAMASLLGTSMFLQNLDLSNNRISMVATCLISSALRQNTTLKGLNLSGNIIGKSGCKALFRVIRWQQLYRHEKTLQKIESLKLAECLLNHDGKERETVVEWPAASVNVDSCIFEDQVNLDLGLHNCNGTHTLNLKNPKDRAKLAELMELSYAGESSPSTWSNCSIDGKPCRFATTPANHSMPPMSGVFEGSLNVTFKACDMPNCIDSSSFSVVTKSIINVPNGTTNTKIAIAISHLSEFVYFSSQQVRDVLLCFDEPEAHYKVLQCMYCKIVDIQQKSVFLKNLSQETIHKMKQRLGQLFDFCSEFPMRHYRIDLSQNFDVELFQKIQSTSSIQRRLAGVIRLPDTSQFPLIPMCIRNFQLNGVRQKDFAKAYALPKTGIIELDFTSIMAQIPDRVPSLKECSDAAFMKMRQLVYSATSNSKLGLDVLASQLEGNTYSITTKQAFFLISLWPPISAQIEDTQELSESDSKLARLNAMVHCYSHISDLHNVWPTLRGDSEYSWNAIRLICCRIGWLNIWNPLDADGYYELDLSFRDQRVVCECLVVLSVKEPGENWQDETFNGQRFELPVTWVTEVPERGIVTLTYTSGLKKRNMLVNIRKQLANRCLVRYCINQLPKNEADMIEEERKMQEMSSEAAAAALAQGYADLAEDDESKELQELILTHTEAILEQEGVVAAIQNEMELRMMDNVQKYLELKKKLAIEEEILEKQKAEVNAVIQEARTKVSAEALETFGIEAQEIEVEATAGEVATSLC